MKSHLIPVEKKEDILKDYLDTPIEEFLLFHNLGEDVPANENANLLICTCIDFRIALKIPQRFAYVIRTAGANATFLEFQIAFAVSVAGIKSIAVIGHDDCAMAGLSSKRQPFIDGMNENAGWNKEKADTYFSSFCSDYEISDPVSFTCLQAEKLKTLFPGIPTAPLLYKSESGKLFQLTSA